MDLTIAANAKITVEAGGRTWTFGRLNLWELAELLETLRRERVKAASDNAAEVKRLVDASLDVGHGAFWAFSLSGVLHTLQEAARKADDGEGWHKLKDGDVDFQTLKTLRPVALELWGVRINQNAGKEDKPDADPLT